MNLEGTWHNELGSTMTIDHVRDGGFTETYVTALSPTGATRGSFKLVGRTDADSGGEAVAFLVRWGVPDSNWWHHKQEGASSPLVGSSFLLQRP